MQIFRSSTSIREALDKDRALGRTIGLVPTMGNLHQAHIELVKIAQSHCDVVVASIFVNPLQFGLNEDWDKYPRTFDRDVEQLTAANCDYLFHPDDMEIYPNGMAEQTRVIVPTMTDILCGASRPGHFEGVTTVLTKFFNIVQPDCAVFGIKDYQQLAIIRRMTEDLCMPVNIIAGEIYREPDGLAMSSRNSFITEQERPKASQLHKSLQWIKSAIVSGERDYPALQTDAGKQIEEAGFRVDYVSIRDANTLELATLATFAAKDDSEVIILGAMYTESARLIDNVRLTLK